MQQNKLLKDFSDGLLEKIAALGRYHLSVFLLYYYDVNIDAGTVARYLKTDVNNVINALKNIDVASQNYFKELQEKEL